jgi:DNA-binding CsgD family transcriptional regulator/PAS domain-containing protein
MLDISQSDVLQKMDSPESIKGVNEKELLHLQLNLSLMLATPSNIDGSIQPCLDIAMQTAAMQSGLIFLCDKSKNKVVHCAHRGLDDLLKHMVHYNAFSDTGETVDYFNDYRFACNVSEVMSERFRSFIKLPIYNRGNLQGWMSLASNATETIPSTVQVYLKTIAKSLENAIAHAKEYQELLKSRAQMDSILSCASGFAVYRLAPDPTSKYKLRKVHISPSIEQILGCAPERWSVADYYDNIHPEDRQIVMTAHELALLTGKFEAVARVYNHTAKKYVWIQANGTGVKNEQGDITHVDGILMDVNEKQEALLEVRRKEKSLELQSEKLKQLNTTLNTLLEKRDKDRLELEQSMVFNIKEMVLPYITQIRNAGSAVKRNRLLDVVEMSLDEISSRFAHSLSTAQLGLTPAEMKVAAFVNQGKSTKEIAGVIGASEKTIKNQRLAIRRKIGINNKKVNLRAYLQSMQL